MKEKHRKSKQHKDQELLNGANQFHDIKDSAALNKVFPKKESFSKEENEKVINRHLNKDAYEKIDARNAKPDIGSDGKFKCKSCNQGSFSDIESYQTHSNT